jgi:hypothetical protein
MTIVLLNLRPEYTAAATPCGGHITRAQAVGKRNSKWQLSPILVAFAAWTGCGSGLSSVSGTVTLDGKPLAGSENVRVTIMFFPESGTGAPAAALADESGGYTVSTGSQAGLAPGNYVVTLSATEYRPAAGGGAPARRVLTPSRYANPKQSGLRAQVEPGRNKFDFNLQSDSRDRSPDRTANS